MPVSKMHTGLFDQLGPMTQWGWAPRPNAAVHSVWQPRFGGQHQQTAVAAATTQWIVATATASETGMLLMVAEGCTAALAQTGVTIQLNSVPKAGMPVLLSLPLACKRLQDRHNQLSSLIRLHS